MYLSIPIVRSSYLTACMQLLESRDAAPNTPWTGWPLHESYTPTPPTPHEQNMEALLPLEGDAPEELSDRTIRKLATYLGILDWKEQQQQASGCDVDHVSDCPKAAQLRHCVRQKLHLLCMGHANVERLKGLTVLYAMTATDDEIDAEVSDGTKLFRRIGPVYNAQAC
ncbi:hypothetical protein K437DRAFT_256255 [Tilletiaria anomala UBC 951]|uniref:Uncharacterized protein n=1 Tax=Tilletiaria anomala (strain ATCC 24038 / CBS 436.72 / UBC 951) TaxID=1037660 RepID=A0A066W6A5_TILAU|nr:uncharacterized protein K437DRAFT_256255 [Tilletiaria anomala UBC 951]KDN46295.1 hypothetical protein K437DRAFT_256255 [Tilletiaria anomala UBC 951]